MTDQKTRDAQARLLTYGRELGNKRREQDARAWVKFGEWTNGPPRGYVLGVDWAAPGTRDHTVKVSHDTQGETT